MLFPRRRGKVPCKRMSESPRFLLINLRSFHHNQGFSALCKETGNVFTESLTDKTDICMHASGADGFAGLLCADNTRARRHTGHST
jgi:hypothetical protein